MTALIKDQLKNALRSQSVYDLYDALADNGLETEEVYGHGSDAAWLIKHISNLLQQSS